jgi:hypothetical protein
MHYYPTTMEYLTSMRLNPKQTRPPLSMDERHTAFLLLPWVSTQDLVTVTLGDADLTVNVYRKGVDWNWHVIFHHPPQLEEHGRQVFDCVHSAMMAAFYYLEDFSEGHGCTDEFSRLLSQAPLKA